MDLRLELSPEESGVLHLGRKHLLILFAMFTHFQIYFFITVSSSRPGVNVGDLETSGEH